MQYLFVSRAKKAALNGPVFITDRGHPAHVLLAIEGYEKIIGTEKNIIELLAMPDAPPNNQRIKPYPSARNRMQCAAIPTKSKK